MTDDLLSRLIDVSHKREDNTVIPLVLQYYTAESLGYDMPLWLDGLETHYDC